MRRLALLVVAVVLVPLACGGKQSSTSGGSGAAAGGGGAAAAAGGGGLAGSAGTGAAAGAGATAADAGAGCGGSAPMCADGCGSDWFPEVADCIGGSWVCPAGTVLPEDCPAGTCWGPPMPAEQCGPNGWECRPAPEHYAECPSLMCPECTGFAGPVELDGCRCTCTGGNVVCEPVPQAPCDGLSFCQCFDRADCAPQTDTCLCPCDYQCPGHDPCDCDCGGGQYLGCAALAP